METFTDDNIFAIAAFLHPTDLASVALVCKRFGGTNKNVTSLQPANNNTHHRQGLPWSMMEEAARRRLSAAKDDKGNPWRSSNLITIRGEESWIAVDQRLYLLRSSLVFSRIIGGGFLHVNGDITRVRGTKARGFSVALCQEVMTSGNHYAEFYVTTPGYSHVGITRPIHSWPKKRIKYGEFNTYCEHQYPRDPGCRCDTNRYWYDNEKVIFQKDDAIGIRLDLGQGVVTVYKNGKCLGVKKDSLTGPFCWAVTTNADYNKTRASIRIGKATMPSLGP